MAEEISFCEKYVYLYQMRYPDQFAYKFEIEETIADVEILSSSFSRSSKIILCMVLTINDKTMLSGPRLPRRRKIIVAVVDNGKESPPIG